jgi:hypothetical protein
MMALEANRHFWSLCWLSSRRGGHYRFQIPKFAAGAHGALEAL